MAVATTWAGFGVIETSTGNTYQGTIEPTEGGFIVACTNGAARVDLWQLARLRFKASPGGSIAITNAQHGLRGTYFSNSDCTGDRVVRIDPQIDFNWQGKYPVPGIGPTDFSVRWEGKLHAPATGSYTFNALCAGMKLWIDNQLILDKFEDMPGRQTSGSVQLEDGKFYGIKVELYNRNLTAMARLFWSGPNLPSSVVPVQVLYAVPGDPAEATQVPKSGLLGMYYNTTDLTGEPISRYDERIDFDWGEEAPLDGINPGAFSVRWLAKLLPGFSEAYTLKISSENGARVWLNGNLVIDAWREEPITATSIPIALRKGQACDLRVEMYAARGAGKAKLQWSSLSTPEQVIPTAQLIPTAALKRDQRASESQPVPPGVKLASGSFLASQIQAANESSIQLAGPAGEAHISLVNIARVIFQPLTPEFAVKIVAGRSGLLLKDKDFIEGEFKGIVGGQIRIQSVLFGIKSYSLSEAMVLVLRDVEAAPTLYEVHLRNGSVLRAKELRVAKENIFIEDSVLKGCNLAMADLLEIGRNK